MKNDLELNTALFADIRKLIEASRSAVAQTVNAGLTMLYWNIGKRINQEILINGRAEYGEQILPTLSAKLEKEYGNGFSKRILKRRVDFNCFFPDFQIVVSLIRQLSWTHFIALIPIKIISNAIFMPKCAGRKMERSHSVKKLIPCCLNGQPSLKNRRIWQNLN